MKKLKKQNKLSLDKEIIRSLSDQKLAGVGGATGDTCLLTPSCKFVCTKVI